MILSLFRKPPAKKPAPKPIEKKLVKKASVKAQKGVKALRAERSYAVAGRNLPLSIWENPRARRLTLRIETGGKGIRVTIPPRLPERELDLFIARHHGWIEMQIAKVPVAEPFTAGSFIAIRGIQHRIVHEPAKRGTTRQDHDLNAQPILIVHGDTLHLGRRIADYLKKLARIDINGLVLLHTQRVGRPAHSVRFKDTTSRWGSCTSKGDLSFSWRIMMAPAEVINYLVAHEVAHLIEMNHGPDFWALCTKLCPDTPSSRAWLKRNGSALHAISFVAGTD